jgi:hypothetical protein
MDVACRFVHHESCMHSRESNSGSLFLGVRALIILTRPVLQEMYSQCHDNAMCDSKNLEPWNVRKTRKNENVPLIAVQYTGSLV